MKRAVSIFSLGQWMTVSILLLAIPWRGATQSFSDDGISRAVYLGHSLHGKGGWRPIVSSGLPGLTAFNLAGAPAGIAQKIMTGPAIVETKVLSPHILGVTSEVFGNGLLSTSSRPIVTRDTNKISGIHGYKTSIYPQNLNAPVSSYLNPFAFTSNGNQSPYKLSPGYQFDSSNIFIRQPVSHRPMYTKSPQQSLVGKRVKQNQFQMMQQITNNPYHQTFQSYQNKLKKPVDSYQRPLDLYQRPIDGLVKPHAYDIQSNSNVQLIVNGQDSHTHTKQTQGKLQTGQGVAAVTYKPPLGSHFQQFGIKEEKFAPIPPSILGSFTSFGHASVKARDPNYSANKNNYVSTPSPTKAPHTPTAAYEYTVSSTANTEVKLPSQNLKASSSQNVNIDIKDDYSKNLVPPPQGPNSHINFNIQNYTDEQIKIEDNFIPSPIDPLSKFEDAQKFSSSKIKQPDNHSTRRPSVTSYFNTNLISISTSSPFESHSTNVVPENYLVQLPPPFTSYNSYNTQNVKSENSFAKNKFQTFAAINHNGVTSKYNTFDDVKYFPPRVPEYSENKYNKNRYPNKEKQPFQHSYEVTENWEPSGEGVTQPTLHSWIKQPQTYKQYSGLLGPPKLPSNIKSTYFPARVPDINYYNDVSTLYPSAYDNKNNDLTIHFENSLSSTINPVIQKGKPNNDDIVFSPTESDEENDNIRISTTENYEETTTNQIFNSRRRPSKYHSNLETSTLSNLEDFTTRFETFKEHAQETENDLQATDLPTIPPNKHFKRPIPTTVPTPIDTWNDDKPKKRNKNRRRRPLRPSPTTEESVVKDTTVATENPLRGNRFRTTVQPDIEIITKISRPRLRFPPPKTRPTKPTNQPELTSSAQPTMVPTHPITYRSKINSRVRTTPPSLDFDDLFETTTFKDAKFAESIQQQSSIMKIAKDTHRSPSMKYPVRFGSYNEAPDYSHKQDEKDTPTSDIAVNTYDVHNESNKHFNTDFTNPDEELLNAVTESHSGTTEPTFLNDQSTLITKTEGFVNLKSEQNKEQDFLQTTTETETTTVNNRFKPKTKYDSNRPRFSVKDYRNRLNMYSSTSTEKTTQQIETTTRIRFPNRSRYSNIKDSDKQTDVGTTEQPRKKFIPKDARKAENEERTPNQKRNNTSDNEVIPKTQKFRSNLRRDPNRQRSTTTTTVAPSEINEKSEQILNDASNSKRPNVNFRKRIHNKNKTIEIPEFNTTESVSISAPDSVFPVYEIQNQTSTEKSTSETAIMKIAKDDKKNSNDVYIENTAMDASQRVSDLTLAASKDYNTPGLFKSVSPSSRRVVPNYFTIATDDPILPIEAFFPQLNQKKE